MLRVGPSTLRHLLREMLAIVIIGRMLRVRPSTLRRLLRETFGCRTVCRGRIMFRTLVVRA
jgi:hypothetical protein